MPMSGVFTQSIDHLGLVAGMIEELDIRASIEDELPTKSEDKKVSHATAVSAMILNGLGYVNKQLYLTPRFFEKKAIGHLLGDDVTAQQLNKDTLGRTLDAIYNYGVSELYEKIAHRAIAILGLAPSTIHLDSTSFHVDGKYKQSSNSDNNTNDKVPIHITKGYSRDHHPQLNQVVLNLIVEHQAGIPLMMKAADGNQVDAKAFASIVNEHIDSLKAVDNTPLTLIADAALFTQKGLEAVKEKNINFIPRVPMRLKEAKAFIANTPKDKLAVIDENYSFSEKSINHTDIKQKWVLYSSRHATKRESKTMAKNLLQESSKAAKAAKKLMLPKH